MKKAIRIYTDSLFEISFISIQLANFIWHSLRSLMRTMAPYQPMHTLSAMNHPFLSHLTTTGLNNIRLRPLVIFQPVRAVNFQPVSTAKFLYKQLIKDADTKGSSRDFGKDIIPSVIDTLQSFLIELRLIFALLCRSSSA
jgi:hypothetical protein